MVPVLIVMGIIVYLMIGGFISGAMEREVNPWWIFFWPLLLLCMLCLIISKIPINLGKKYYNRVNKWLDDHL